MSTITILILYIYRDIKQPILKSLFYFGLMFGFISMSLIPLSIRNILMVCYHNVLPIYSHQHLVSWFGILYFIQLYLLWLILFIRLHTVTCDGAYQLNKYTFITFKIIFLLCPIISIIYIIYSVIHEITAKTANDHQSHLFLNISLMSLLMIFGAVIPIILTFLFISKLMQIYKDSKQCMSFFDQKKYQRLIPVITRNTILAIISVSITILTIISFFIHVVISCYMGLFNIYSNFICIMFAYKCFHKAYNKICSPLDTKCRNFCMEIMNKDNNDIENGENENGIEIIHNNSTSENHPFVNVDGQQRHNSVPEIMEQESKSSDSDDDVLEQIAAEINDNLSLNGTLLHTDAATVRFDRLLTNTTINHAVYVHGEDLCFDSDDKESDIINKVASVYNSKIISDIETVTTMTECHGSQI
eukprot:143009_1